MTCSILSSVQNIHKHHTHCLTHQQTTFAGIFPHISYLKFANSYPFSELLSTNKLGVSMGSEWYLMQKIFVIES